MALRSGDILQHLSNLLFLLRRLLVDPRLQPRWLWPRARSLLGFVCERGYKFSDGALILHRDTVDNRLECLSKHGLWRDLILGVRADHYGYHDRQSSARIYLREICPTETAPKYDDVQQKRMRHAPRGRVVPSNPSRRYPEKPSSSRESSRRSPSTTRDKRRGFIPSFFEQDWLHCGRHGHYMRSDVADGVDA